ncbi:hypothetical protein [Aminobacterium mobile]|uniref:hypothetical protein n=1 Tax=Aminobacterium mobile TaxID=81467 RepID=UPI0033156105
MASDYQRKGIGGRLIEVGHQVAQNLGFKSALLVRHPTYCPCFDYPTGRDVWNCDRLGTASKCVHGM